MKKIYITLLVLGCAGMLIAQNNPINMLRYNDNFQYLNNDTIVKKGIEKLKRIPLSKNAFLSIGGDVREQLMHTENQNFGDVPPNTKAVSATQLWHRVMLHADVKLGKKVRVFTQLNHTLRLFNPNPLVEIDENLLGLHQTFVELQPTTPQYKARQAGVELRKQPHFDVAYQHNNQWAFYFDTAYFTAADFTEATGKGLPIGYYSFKSSFKF